LFDESPLTRLQPKRAEIISAVARETGKQFEKERLELILGQTLFAERQRLRREKPNLFTRSRKKHDTQLWNRVQAGLLQPSFEVDRAKLLGKITSHYAEEIAGYFSPDLYEVAVKAVPWAFDWLLNAASLQRFVPWGHRQSLRDRLRIHGDIAQLKHLAQKGTILLVPTHQSNLDSLLIGYVIYRLGLPPFSYGAGLNLFSNPVLGFFMNRLGAFTVDRQKSNAVYRAALKTYATRILQEGVHTIFFPGGTRARGGAIESKLKLGLLGTGMHAQIANHMNQATKPNVYIVPMVTSYHFVLEAASLIDDYLAQAGQHRYIITDDESWQTRKVLSFFWKFFTSQTNIEIRVGRALDIFGNPVDDEGYSLGPNGTIIDPKRWLTTSGELCFEPQRDAEYTRELGERIVERFHSENTVLTSHLVAFAFFETLRKKYPDLDLYRFLRLTPEQRVLHKEVFLEAAQAMHTRIKEMADHGKIHLSQDLLTPDPTVWVADGIKQLGALHDVPVVIQNDNFFETGDMNLLYYYRNRLSGYGLSLRAEAPWTQNPLGGNDDQGFLA